MNVDFFRELESEMNRIRLFYHRKIDDLKSKHEIQLRALKRGPVTGDTNTNPDTSMTELTVPKDTNDIISHSNHQQQYEKKMLALEQELLKTAEELGKAKKELAFQRIHPQPSDHTQERFKECPDENEPVSEIRSISTHSPSRPSKYEV
jgi:hypothetical protein